MTSTNVELGRRIEQMVAEHIAGARKVAQEAMERAFAASRVAVPAGAVRRVHSRAAGKRRADAELAMLAERFYQVLSRKPGETMMVLAAEVGVSASELRWAVARLKQAGHVRSVGKTKTARYFPLTGAAT